MAKKLDSIDREIGKLESRSKRLEKRKLKADKKIVSATKKMDKTRREQEATAKRIAKASKRLDKVRSELGDMGYTYFATSRKTYGTAMVDKIVDELKNLPVDSVPDDYEIRFTGNVAYTSNRAARKAGWK